MSSAIVYCHSKTNMSPSSINPLRHALFVNRVRKCRALQSRSIWWWGRHGTWHSANEHDNMEERLHRAQKIMRYKYSKALKRRSIWERDNSPHHWNWCGSGRLFGRAWDCKPLSTSEHMSAKVKEQGSSVPQQDRPWDQLQRDFEAYKAAVDEAIAKDPYGVLFGRRLRSSSTDKSSSWSSFSRIFNPSEAHEEVSTNTRPAKDPVKIKIDNLDAENPRKSSENSNIPSPKSSSANASTIGIDAPEEYVYDPVSGRKVLRSSVAHNNFEIPKKSFLETMFGEHGSDTVTTPVKADVTKAGTTAQPLFENSRSHQYSQLRAATLGTNIDTTVAFGGKHEPLPEAEVEVQSRKRRFVPEEDPGVALFTGTTYENKDLSHRADRPSSKATTSNWLQREGFEQPSESKSISKPSETRSLDHKLQPAIDRMRSDKNEVVERRYITKLQPSIDRIQLSKTKQRNAVISAPLNMVEARSATKSSLVQVTRPIQRDLAIDTREDLDLLRASDVRAATKVARVTKQEIAQAKADATATLEADFARRQKDAEVSSDIDSARTAARNSKGASGIHSVMKHMQRYPDGIVARTMQSMGVLNDGHKPYLAHGATHKDLTEKIEASSEALAKLPSIFKETRNRPDSKVPSESTKEALQTEKMREESAVLLKTKKQHDQEMLEKETKQIQELANTINKIYQAHTDLSQPAATNEINDQEQKLASAGRVPEENKHPLSSATVKPGVPRYVDIEHHTRVFEPQLIETRKKLKTAQKNASELDVAVADFTRKYRGLSQHHHQPENLGGQILEAKQDKVMASEESHEIMQPSEFLSSATSARTMSSPYVILTYNKQSKEVDVTQLSKLMGFNADQENANPIAVMSGLNNAAAFVLRFAELERVGYTLMGGGGDVLIFKNQSSKTTHSGSNAEALESIRSIKSVISEIRNKIANEEARSQPVFPSAVQDSATKRAATVLHQIPREISPTDTTAPKSSTNPASPPKKKTRDGPKVRRQEQVFSGTLRTNTGPEPQKSSNATNSTLQPGLVTRALSAVRRIVLTLAALGGAAYAIGVVSEGMGAHAQYQKAITEGNNDEIGPRRKIVMPTSRPGFYSTESTRD